MTRRTVQSALHRPHRDVAIAVTTTDGGVRLLLITPHHTGAVYVRDGFVDVIGTAPEYQRLIGLSVAALQAYASQRGWRVVAPTETGRTRT